MMNLHAPGLLALAGLLSASCATTSDFDDITLEELLNTPVVSATKTEGRLAEAPAVITVVTRDDLARWGYRSVAEVLRHIVGFYVVDDHAIPNAGVRGVPGGLFGESSAIKVMIDGHSVAFRTTSGNWLGAERIPLTAISRIEIIRGPGSALYGADAFLGVVNIITRTGDELAGASLAAQAGLSTDGNTGLRLDLSLGARRGDAEIVAAVLVDEEDRSGLTLPASSPAPSLPAWQGADPGGAQLGLASRSGLLKAAYHFDESSWIGVLGTFSSLERGADFAPWAQFTQGLDAQGRSSGTLVSLFQAQAGLQAEWAPVDSFTLALKAFYFTGGPTDDDRIEVGSDLYWIRRELGYDGAEVSLEGRWRILETLSAVVGAEVIYDREEAPRGLRVSKVGGSGFAPGDTIDDTRDAPQAEELLNVGAFLQLSWQAVAKLLSVTGGFRYDHHSLFGHQVSGRVGAVSSPVDGLFLKLLYGSAFKAPSPLLLYATPYRIGDVLGNRALEAQYVHTIEFQTIYQPLDYATISTVLAYSYLTNKADFTQQGVNRIARNLAQVAVLSWETEVRAHYRDWIRGYASFELQHAVRDLGEPGYVAELTGSDNVIFPDFIVRAGVSGRLPEIPLRLSCELLFVPERRASAMNILEAGASYSLDAYALLDLHVETIGLQIIGDKLTTFALRGQNLLGSQGPDPGFVGIDYPLTATTLWLQLRQEL